MLILTYKKMFIYRYRGNTVVFITVTAVNRWHRSPLPRQIFNISPRYRGNYRGNAVITAVNRPVSLSTMRRER